jgi:hypothetical protein
MGYKRLAVGFLVVLLLAGVVSVSASTPARDLAYSDALGVSTQIFKKNLAETPSWQQVNSNGFGVQANVEVSALSVFNSCLYAGVSNPTDGARIFRSDDGLAWNPVSQPGFGNPHDTAPPAILDMVVFNGRIYASTGRGDGPGQIWRSLDGVNWAPMVIAGFSDPDTVDVTVLAVYNGLIYAGAGNLISGAQVWRSFSGDSNTWVQVAPEVPATHPARITGFAEFDGGLYAAIESDMPAQIWSSYGGVWTTVMDDGFGDALTTSTGGLVQFGGYLYVGAGNENEGAQIWRSNDGMNWEQAIEPGFGDPNNRKVEMVFVFQGNLYAGVKNTQTGLEIWRSPDGINWEQVNQDGFGDKNNSSTNGSNAVVEFQGDLFVGTVNQLDGGELWRMEGLAQPPPPTATPPPPQQPGHSIYIPVVNVKP